MNNSHTKTRLDSLTSTGLENTNIERLDLLIEPAKIKAEIPATHSATQTVISSRAIIQNILTGKDNRLLIICGPCSIHDSESAKEYARKLKKLHDIHSDKLFIVMRVYFEKPRTHIGWKGLINDPHIDGTNDINTGLRTARSLLAWINNIGLPCASETLDPITPQYIGDLISWAAIGARTTESQTHREMVSGLSMPVGFKNGTDGGLDVAINAMISAQSPHSFIGIDNNGKTALLRTKGNPYSHIILRGGEKPNYDSQSVFDCIEQLKRKKLTNNIIVDCSHGNSNKDYTRQPLVFKDLVQQRVAGNSNIIGLMLESHLIEGSQSMSEPLIYGKSITDACINWQTTEELLHYCDQWLK
ncbi:MAG: 3-deoxy-7-phosphoheptulonate synthase [Kangiellaceae bacterium]|nr:3-deoxy-7-phosphoheptulonate synthase [Kangiellaceae bacterium]